MLTSRQVETILVDCADISQPGKVARQYLNGPKKLSMEFRQASPRKAKATKPVKRKSGQPQIDGFTHKVNNPIARKRSHQQIVEETRAFDDSPWGDTDEDYMPSDEDPIIELSDDGDLPLSTKKRRTLEPVAQLRASEAAAVDRSDTTSPVEQCFRSLRALQSSVRGRNALASWRTKADMVLR